MTATGKTDRTGDWFQTYSGVEFYLLDPRVEEIKALDIAYALANQCRFNGNCLRFYSVAQHCVLASEIVPPEFALWGLLHDSGEAYIGDMVRPLKSSMPLFCEAEDRIMRTICDKFGLSHDMPNEVKDADNILLATEKRDLMTQEPRSWGYISTLTPLEYRIHPWTREEAADRFLARLYVLLGRTDGT